MEKAKPNVFAKISKNVRKQLIYA